MSEIKRTELGEEWAHSGIVEAGSYAFISYCMGNEGQSTENQINGAFDLLGTTSHGTTSHGVKREPPVTESKGTE